MSIKKSYAVFGLGRYGKAVAKELIENGATVIAVDMDSRIVDDLVDIFPICKCADITDVDVIKQLGISNIDTVIIAIAGNFEASVMATMLCKEAGVNNVIVKCANDMHCTILKKVGADMVVLPEYDSGVRIAKNLLSSGFIDIADISDNISILEIEPKTEWIGKTLRELELRQKYSINVIALRMGSEIDVSMQPDDVISEAVRLIVIADKEKTQKIK